VAALLAGAGVALPAGAAAEQASQPTSAAAGQLDASGGADDSSGHTCALTDAKLRCWGFGGGGRLGYANANTIGDDETPGAVAPVDLGPGRSAGAISAGAFHTCGLLDDGSVSCWGFGAEGRLGYGNTDTIGDDETPGSAGPVKLGAGGPAVAISAGGGHTCVVLMDGNVRCWGFGGDGRLGYGDSKNIGDDETPDKAGPVDLGTGRTAKAISAGGDHTCGLLDDGSVRCWGFGSNGQLGYGNPDTIGNDEKPGSVGPVELGKDRKATAISAGDGHTCALLDDGSVRCWGYGGNGRLGYGNTDTIGDNEAPGSVGPVDLGGKATAISAGDNYSCAVLDDGSVRCWGFGGDGRLGYGNTLDVGDNEPPGSVGPVDLGPGRKAVAISAGGRHTCARLDDGGIRCWGDAATGRLGYCNANDIGDDEAPGSVGPVNVSGSSACPVAAAPPGSGGGGASPAPGGAAPAAPPAAGPAPRPAVSFAERLRALYRRAVAAQAARKRGLAGCYAKVRAHARREQRSLRRLHSSRRRSRARRHVKRHLAQGRRTCRKRYGRTPGRVTHLSARAASRSKVVLSFRASGTAASRPPAARSYVIKQSRKPIRSSRDFRRRRLLTIVRNRGAVALLEARNRASMTSKGCVA